MEKNYKLIELHGRHYVVCNNKRPDANFMKTEKALCGVLKRRQSLAGFVFARKERIAMLDAENEKIKLPRNKQNSKNEHTSINR